MTEEKVHNMTLEVLVSIRDEIRRLRQEIKDLKKELLEFKDDTNHRFQDVGEELDLIETRLERCLAITDELETLKKAIKSP
ncbi:hypothetical protein [Thermosulfuriphilus sp.]